MSVTAGQCLLLRKGNQIRNVVKSTQDIKPLIWGRPQKEVIKRHRKYNVKNFQSWIAVWKYYTGNYEDLKCCVCGANPNEIRCRIIGAHIVLGDENWRRGASTKTDMLQGSDRVFIVPLCNTCNGQHKTLTLKEDVKALNLLYYFTNYKTTERNGRRVRRKLVSPEHQIRIDNICQMPRQINYSDTYYASSSRCSRASCKSSASKKSVSYYK